MNELKAIELKDKNNNVIGTYVEVHERIRYFREAPEYYGWSITTEILPSPDKTIMMQTKVINTFGVVVATGIAMEKEDSSFINKGSHVENCETSAWGRAMACLGIGITEHVRSREEMENAISNQEPMTSEQRNKISKLMGTLEKSVTQKVRANIFNEMNTFTPEKADLCIAFLEPTKGNCWHTTLVRAV